MKSKRRNDRNLGVWDLVRFRAPGCLPRWRTADYGPAGPKGTCRILDPMVDGARASKVPSTPNLHYTVAVPSSGLASNMGIQRPRRHTHRQDVHSWRGSLVGEIRLGSALWRKGGVASLR